jgi:FkbM family methyltransferase
MQDANLVEQDFSQHGEQPLILAWLAQYGEVPRYCVDAGAFDGITGSNTRALLLLGWSGLLIEPDPRTFAQLRKVYADRPDVRCLRRALSHRSGLRRMQLCQGPPGTPPETAWHYAQVNTFHRPFAETYVRDHRYQYTSIWVRVTTLTKALHRAGAPKEIGFLSVDCEGEDLAVLSGLDLSQFRPHLLSVECDDNTRPTFSTYLGSRGYKYYASTVSNSLFCLDG